MFEFELKNGKKVTVVGNFKVNITNYGDLVLQQDDLKKKSLNTMFNEMNDKLNDDFYKESIAISKEKPQSVSYEDLQKKKDYENLIHCKFQDFIDIWDTNFGIEETDQPDRVKLLRDTMPFDGKKIMDFIDFHGGLTNGVLQVIDQRRFDNHTEFRKYCRLLAENITQVSSIICPPLATKLEYPFKP